MRRLSYMIVLLIALSMVVSAVIEFPPGDHVTSYTEQMGIQPSEYGEKETANLKRLRSLDHPIHRQYLDWVRGLIRASLALPR